MFQRFLKDLNIIRRLYLYNESQISDMENKFFTIPV